MGRRAGVWFSIKVKCLEPRINSVLKRMLKGGAYT
jgi:hypothetical protein